MTEHSLLIPFEKLATLAEQLDGELHYDKLMQVLYATDASVYRDLPLAVAIPKSVKDIETVIKFAKDNRSSIIPRAAGTSLAGQCVGKGIVVDISKNLNKILDFNAEEQWVVVEPGVVRDQLNHFLKPHGFFFSPITSTANRATIGGMVGNNSSGTSSIQYGSTRDHILALDAILSDGSKVSFGAIDKAQFDQKRNQDDLEGKIYTQLFDSLHKKDVQENIKKEFPKPTIHRRNTGYALDYLLNTEAFTDSTMPLDLCKFLAGSEGTLAFTTRIKLHIDELPPPEVVVVAAHFTSINDCLLATQVAMKMNPSACELMDKIILDCTLSNVDQSKNRFFVEGDPAGVLMVEFRADTQPHIQDKADQFIQALRKINLGYAYPQIYGDDTKKVWQLRSAGLGLLANIPGDKKAVACIEDTAVDLQDLPEYIEEFSVLMSGFRQKSVYYAHAGAGEIHLRPILDLKKSVDVQAFYDISLASAQLVKKYKGSLSGEHGDGRVRAAFIPLMVGDENYELFRQIKQCWDPQNIFNPGKIVDAEPMNESLRYEPDTSIKEVETLLDFSSTEGILRAAEKCNGSGDCRKTSISGGTMCPSYQATLDEKDTTRARANALREFLTTSEKANPFDQSELKEVMDLCISCKACSSECPSNVDMSSLKAEFQYQFYKDNRIPLRTRIFAHINDLNKLGSIAPRIYNFLIGANPIGKLNASILGISSRRYLPKLQKRSLRKWYRKHYKPLRPKAPIKKVYLFCDEFTNYNDVPIGVAAIELLAKLGYDVHIINHDESGRAALSKGLLEKARKHAEKNVQIFAPIITEETPLIGIEPSAILGFRDEYPRIVRESLRELSSNLSKNCLLIDEFIAQESAAGHIKSSSFSQEHKSIKFHGHCHQKSLSDPQQSVWLLSLPINYHVETIPSGCCGMAGSFGYEKEHFDVSRKIGELILFPAVRSKNSETLIAATGTSCRHQIQDFCDIEALHPVQILREALIDS